MVRELRRVRSGEEITSDWANALVDAVTALGQITAAYPLEVSRDAAGLRLSLAAGLKIELVELTSDLNSGGEATAKILVRDGDDWVDAATSEIDVEDPLGTFEGATGDRALVLFHRQSGKWLVLQLEC